MKPFVAVFALYLIVCPRLSSAQAMTDKSEKLVWLTDISKAYEVSNSTKKPIFAFFTGSDWCGWCHKLEREVFAKPEFTQWAKQNVILLELDFPRNKQLPPELVQQNQSLQRAFRVTGYPTIWVFNLAKDSSNRFNISPLGSLGYPQGALTGREEVKFLQDADRVLAKKGD